MRNWRRAALIAGAALLLPAGAGADVTAFLGASPTGGTRAARGLAAGAGIVVVGFELEVASLTEDAAAAAPGLTTGMANVMLQTPVEVSRVQAYGTTGLGLYRERAGDDTETSLAANLGGGVKIRLAGPLKLRLDYRLFRLRGEPRLDVVHRFYAGATIGF
ncbi:MAG: hypothetical protein AB7U83_18930 [Vicinamibacterales bacterium]